MINQPVCKYCSRFVSIKPENINKDWDSCKNIFWHVSCKKHAEKEAKVDFEDYNFCPTCSQPIINKKSLISKNPAPYQGNTKTLVNWSLAVDLYHRGWKQTGIAELFGVSVAAISRKFGKLGVSRPEKRRESAKLGRIRKLQSSPTLVK